jgi:hypothetical protein
VNERECLAAVNRGLQATMHYATRDDMGSCGSGRVIAYSMAPMVCIELDSGERVWWRADLTTIGEEA